MRNNLLNEESARLPKATHGSGPQYFLSKTYSINSPPPSEPLGISIRLRRKEPGSHVTIEVTRRATVKKDIVPPPTRTRTSRSFGKRPFFLNGVVVGAQGEVEIQHGAKI